MKLETDSLAFELAFKIILTFLVLIFFLTVGLSQQRLELNLRGGMTTGSPLIVKDIPEGATGRPGLGINAGLELSYIFHPRFSITVGAAYAHKKSSFASPVNGKYDAARGVFGERFPFPVRVNYTGDVEASFNNVYLDFPILANWQLKKWRIGVGYQYSHLLKGGLDGLVNVKALFMNFDNQLFDDSENIKTYDHMIITKISRQLSDRITMAADFTISTHRLLIEAEEGFRNPRNVYVNLLAGFRLF